ncbi:MAG: BatD family protein, partial [Planctomycetaceae bacterium]|nr:BatD family protein [Planctomycetaceae bacterium]
MFNCFFVICVLISFHVFGGELLAELSMTVAADRAVVYKGERIVYQIAVTDSKQIEDSFAPDLSGYNDFDVRVLPKQLSNNSGSSFQVVINGKMVRNESSTQSRVLFTYELTPKREGNLLIPSPVVVVGGRQLVPVAVQVIDKSGAGNVDGSIPVAVKPPDEQDIVKMWIETDHKKLYPFQPFNVTLVVQVQSLPPDVLQPDTSPIAVLREPPNITIGWANDNSLPKGLRPAQLLNEWLTSISAAKSQRGFSINEYATRGIGFDDDFFGSSFGGGGFGNVMNDMMRGRVLHFAPTPKKVVRQNVEGANVTYWEYRFTRKFTSNEIGEYKFDATLKGNFAAADRSSREGASLKRIYAIAPEVLVNVVDVPAADRPESYVG